MESSASPSSTNAGAAQLEVAQPHHTPSFYLSPASGWLAGGRRCCHATNYKGWPGELQAGAADSTNGYRPTCKRPSLMLRRMVAGAANGRRWSCKRPSPMLQRVVAGAATGRRRSCKRPMVAGAANARRRCYKRPPWEQQTPVADATKGVSRSCKRPPPMIQTAVVGAANARRR
jgi:hypothetical protein